MSSNFISRLVQGSGDKLSGGNATTFQGTMAQSDPMNFSENNPFEGNLDNQSTLVQKKPVQYNEYIWKPKHNYLRDSINDDDDLESIVQKGEEKEKKEKASKPRAESSSSESQEEDFANTGEKEKELEYEKRTRAERAYENKTNPVKNSETVEEKFSDRIAVNSDKFKEYCEYLFENGRKNTFRTHLCLSCWQFISKSQRYQHKRVGHQILDNYQLTNESQLLEHAIVHDKLVTKGGQKFKKGPAPTVADIDKAGLEPGSVPPGSNVDSGSAMRQDHAAIDPLIQYAKAFLIPFTSYQRQNLHAVGDTNITSGAQKEGFIPICASNETYLEELRKLVHQRLTLADQEGALREIMLRNKEEFLLKKKNQNLVDEMQLGLISLEKTYTVIRDLTANLLQKTIEEQYASGKAKSQKLQGLDSLIDEDVDMDFEFKN